MILTINGRQMTVRDDLKELFDRKLKKFDRYFGEDTPAHVTLSTGNDLERVEITISYNGTLFRSERADTTFQCALDSCISVLEGQIRRNKTRLEKKLRQGAFLPVNEDMHSAQIEEEPEFRIRTKEISIKPMTPEEVILQMNLLDHTFFVFENSETGCVNVVYRRHGDSYGLIVPA